jgi:hypothetical protein
MLRRDKTRAIHEIRQHSPKRSFGVKKSGSAVPPIEEEGMSRKVADAIVETMWIMYLLN